MALPITVTPFDPRDTVSITITGVPADATLSAGINNGNGSWTLTPAQLNGLTLTAGEATTATLTVTATNTGGATASVSDTISLMVNPLTPPTVTITSAGGLTNQATQTITGMVTAAAKRPLPALGHAFDNGTKSARRRLTPMAAGRQTSPYQAGQTALSPRTPTQRATGAEQCGCLYCQHTGRAYHCRCRGHNRQRW